MMELQQVQKNMEAKGHGLLKIPHNNRGYIYAPMAFLYLEMQAKVHSSPGLE